MAQRQTAAEANATRPDFNSKLGFEKSAPVDREWKAGQGLNAHSATERFTPAQTPGYHVIEIGKTEVKSSDLYKVMCGNISPRPVALVGTYNEQGLPNLAPISWYQMVSHDPPMAMISFGGSGAEGKLKDSDRNIRRNKCYTISSSCEPYLEALNYACIDAPPNTSEFALAGLTPVPGRTVNAPRVGEAPFSMELEVDFTKEWNGAAGHHTTTMVVGKIKMLHLRKDIFNPDYSIDISKTMPVSRFGGLTYGRTVVGYDLDRPKWSDAEKDAHVKEILATGPKAPPANFDKDDVLPHFPPRSDSSSL